MGRRRKKKKRVRWKIILLLIIAVVVVHEGRFCFPKHIRPPKGVEPVEIEFKTTSYCHCRKCCSYKWFLFLPYQKTGFLEFRRKHVGQTASGVMVAPGSIAADTNLFPFGTIMHIPGYGYGRVEDTGGAIKGKHIDLYRPNHWWACAVAPSQAAARWASMNAMWRWRRAVDGRESSPKRRLCPAVVKLQASASVGRHP